METLPLSVLLLARDEEDRLEALLPRLDFAREVVVVLDRATRDRSREVAERHGARVVERALEDFGRQRQFGLEQCREPWVLWIDADERLDAAGVAGLRAAIAAEGPHGGYRVERRTWFLGRRIRHCGWSGERIVRLFRRASARFDPAPVHESVTVAGAIGELPGTLEHHSYPEWRSCRDKLVLYAARGAERARQRGRRAGPLDLIARPPLRFLRMYVLQAGFLDGAHGLALCVLASAQVALKYLELWADPGGPGRAR